MELDKCKSCLVVLGPMLWSLSTTDKSMLLIARNYCNTLKSTFVNANVLGKMKNTAITVIVFFFFFT